MQCSIKDLAMEDMPRERLWHHGPKALSNAELLAVVIGSGTRKQNALSLAGSLLQVHEGLSGLSQASPEELMQQAGIGKTRALQITASLELARRLDARPKSRLVSFKSPEDVYRYLKQDLMSEGREHFVVLAVNTKNEIIGRHIVSIGTLNQTLVHPREVFNWAIKRLAAGVIIAHNHPSGHVEPSLEDLQLTKRMVSCGELLGIKVIDHIIMTHHQYYSLKAHDHL